MIAKAFANFVGNLMTNAKGFVKCHKAFSENGGQVTKCEGTIVSLAGISLQTISTPQNARHSAHILSLP